MSSSKDPGRPTEMRLVKVRDLVPHPEAQRKLVPAGLKKIEDTLQLTSIGVMHAVEYFIDGVKRLWVVDGQHRWTILMKYGYEDVEIDVMVHTTVVTHADAHALFLRLNTRSAVSPYDTFRNQLGEGQPTAVAVNRITRDHGLTIRRHKGDGNVQCVKTLADLYEKSGETVLADTLKTVTTAWGRTAAAVEGKAIEGVGLVFSRYNGEVDKPALVKKLQKYPGGAAGVLGSAKGLQAVRKASLAKCVAEIVLETYNVRRRNQLDPI